MKTKEAKTISEQIEILRSRGLIINDVSFAEEILSHTNYYVLTGYLHSFKEPDETYTEGLSFENLFTMCECDKRFRNIILYALDEIEHNVKTKIAYILAHSIGPLGYLNHLHFKDHTTHELFLSRLYNAIDNNKKLPFVIHHLKNYDGKFPIWVASELLTIGMIRSLYKNIKTPLQKEIAKAFGTGTRQFENWLRCINYLRNMAAHYMRLYNLKISTSPMFDKKLKNPPTLSYFVFDIIYLMKHLIPDKQEWNNYIIPRISQLFDEYSEHIDIASYGFPKDWESKLKIL